MQLERYYEDYASRAGLPVIVMLPGIGRGAANYRMGIAPLLDQFRVILINNSGMNHTRMPVRFTVERMARKVRDVLKHLGIEKAHVVGHSMGGFVAQRFTLMHPDMVDKLVLVSTSYGGPHSQTYAASLVQKLYQMQHGKNVLTILDDPEHVFFHGIFNIVHRRTAHGIPCYCTSFKRHRFIAQYTREAFDGRCLV